VFRLTPKIVEVVIKAPMAARAFKPGQFYRLQNYETLAPRVDGTTLAMEGLALTGAAVDKEAGLLSTIVLEVGGSSDNQIESNREVERQKLNRQFPDGNCRDVVVEQRNPCNI